MKECELDIRSIIYLIHVLLSSFGFKITLAELYHPWFLILLVMNEKPEAAFPLMIPFLHVEDYTLVIFVIITNVYEPLWFD